jgi:hypothetical protein
MNYCFREDYFEYFESCNFSRENTNIDVSVFIVDLRMINMLSECEYDWNWKISAWVSSWSRDPISARNAIECWISICYLDVYWLIPKYLPAEPEYETCWRVSEANESQTYILSSRLIFFSINLIHLHVTYLSSLNQPYTRIHLYLYLREKKYMIQNTLP